MKNQLVTALLLLLFVQAAAASEQGLAAELAEMRQLIGEMKNDYESRIALLEERLARAESKAENAKRDAGEAYAIAEQSAIEQSSGSSSASAFNPALGRGPGRTACRR